MEPFHLSVCHLTTEPHSSWAKILDNEIIDLIFSCFIIVNFVSFSILPHPSNIEEDCCRNYYLMRQFLVCCQSLQYREPPLEDTIDTLAHSLS